MSLFLVIKSVWSFQKYSLFPETKHAYFSLWSLEQNKIKQNATLALCLCNCYVAVRSQLSCGLNSPCITRTRYHISVMLCSSSRTARVLDFPMEWGKDDQKKRKKVLFTIWGLIFYGKWKQKEFGYLNVCLEYKKLGLFPWASLLIFLCKSSLFFASKYWSALLQICLSFLDKSPGAHVEKNPWILLEILYFRNCKLSQVQQQ